MLPGLIIAGLRKVRDGLSTLIGDGVERAVEKRPRRVVFQLRDARITVEGTVEIELTEPKEGCHVPKVSTERGA